MIRLTEKVNYGSSWVEEIIETGEYIPLNYSTDTTTGKCIDKLGALEDIEEMLGMDLVSAVELCNKVNEQHYIYVQETWGLSKIKFLDDLDIELFNHRLYSNSRGMWFSFDLKEHKKTWWLREDKSE